MGSPGCDVLWDEPEAVQWHFLTCPVGIIEEQSATQLEIERISFFQCLFNKPFKFSIMSFLILT